MATAVMPKQTAGYTLGGLYRRFGAIPFDRIRAEPAPGNATEADVVAIRERERLLFELVDGVLVRKVMGAYESFLACVLIQQLNNFVRPRKLGVVLGPDGMIRLNPGLVRIPDAAFIAIDRLPNRRMPREPICPVVPDIAIEILSKGNTAKEMAEKRAEYFDAGVRIVWFVDHIKRTVRVFTARERSRLFQEGRSVDAGAVLPGFTLEVAAIFDEADAGRDG